MVGFGNEICCKNLGSGISHPLGQRVKLFNKQQVVFCKILGDSSEFMTHPF